MLIQPGMASWPQPMCNRVAVGVDSVSEALRNSLIALRVFTTSHRSGRDAATANRMLASRRRRYVCESKPGSADEKRCNSYYLKPIFRTPPSGSARAEGELLDSCFAIRRREVPGGRPAAESEELSRRPAEGRVEEIAERPRNGYRTLHGRQ